jgi:hypothetical protein
VDPASDSFTLDSVMSLRLDQHAELVAELSVNASKEAAIEASLQGIAGAWALLPLDLAEYKATHKLRSTEDVGAAWPARLPWCSWATHPCIYLPLAPIALAGRYPASPAPVA